jgi:hypothetical protein
MYRVCCCVGELLITGTCNWLRDGQTLAELVPLFRCFLDIATFWDKAPCSPYVNRRFGRTCDLHLDGRKSEAPPAARWFLARLILDPEDGGYTFLRNVGSFSDYRELYPRDGNIHNYRCENLSSYRCFCILYVQMQKRRCTFNIFVFMCDCSGFIDITFPERFHGNRALSELTSKPMPPPPPSFPDAVRLITPNPIQKCLTDESRARG